MRRNKGQKRARREAISPPQKSISIRNSTQIGGDPPAGSKQRVHTKVDKDIFCNICQKIPENQISHANCSHNYCIKCLTQFKSSSHNRQPSKKQGTLYYECKICSFNYMESQRIPKIKPNVSNFKYKTSIQEIQLICQTCNNQFSGQRKYEQHECIDQERYKEDIGAIYEGGESQNQDIFITCPYCKLGIEGEEDFKGHIFQKHSEEAEQDFTKECPVCMLNGDFYGECEENQSKRGSSNSRSQKGKSQKSNRSRKDKRGYKKGLSRLSTQKSDLNKKEGFLLHLLNKH